MGRVYLIGAGPGDPDLLTLKAARILAQADVVLHDALVSREVLSMISPKAEILDVGKRCGIKLLSQDEINSLLIAHSGKHGVVVRLKGGDPLIFGRAGEEIQALRDAGVECEIVPGITAAIGAAAVAGISLTDRRAASQILFTTFSRGAENRGPEWDAINERITVAIYMPGRDYAEVASRLLDHGLSAETPCAVISQATSAQQKIQWTCVGNLYHEITQPAPAILIVGKVAAREVREIHERFSLPPRGQIASLDHVFTAGRKN